MCYIEHRGSSVPHMTSSSLKVSTYEDHRDEINLTL